MPISLQVVVSIHAFQQLLVFMNERTNGGASIEWVRGLGRLCMCVYACLLGGVRFLRGEGRGGDRIYALNVMMNGIALPLADSSRRCISLCAPLCLSLARCVCLRLSASVCVYRR